MNAYVGRLRNVHRLAQLLRMRMFSDTFGTIKQNKEQLVKHRVPGTKMPLKNQTQKQEGRELSQWPRVESSKFQLSMKKFWYIFESSVSHLVPSMMVAQLLEIVSRLTIKCTRRKNGHSLCPPLSLIRVSACGFFFPLLPPHFLLPDMPFHPDSLCSIIVNKHLCLIK